MFILTSTGFGSSSFLTLSSSTLICSIFEIIGDVIFISFSSVLTGSSFISNIILFSSGFCSLFLLLSSLVIISFFSFLGVSCFISSLLSNIILLLSLILILVSILVFIISSFYCSLSFSFFSGLSLISSFSSLII